MWFIQSDVVRSLAALFRAPSFRGFSEFSIQFTAAGTHLPVSHFPFPALGDSLFFLRI